MVLCIKHCIIFIRKVLIPVLAPGIYMCIIQKTMVKKITVKYLAKTRSSNLQIRSCTLSRFGKNPLNHPDDVERP